MISSLFYIGQTALLGFFAYKYKKTGDIKHLKSASTMLFVLTFTAALPAAVNALLYPDKRWLLSLVLFGGTLAGGLTLARCYAGWRQLYALAQAVIFLSVTGFITSSLNYFEKVIVYQHAEAAIVRAVPGAAPKGLPALNGPEKDALALELAGALSGPDRYIRLGALYKLRDLKQAAVPAIPAVIPLLDPSDPFTAELALGLLKELGPAAKDAVPAITAGLAGADTYFRYHLEDALKTILVSTAAAK